jgi:hypothetical protein
MGGNVRCTVHLHASTCLVISTLSKQILPSFTECLVLRWNVAFFHPIREVFPDILWSSFNFGLRSKSFCLDDGFRANRFTPGGYTGYNYEGYNCSASTGAVVGNVDAGSVFYYGFGSTAGAYSLATAAEATLVQRLRSVAAVEFNLRTTDAGDHQRVEGIFPWISYASLCMSGAGCQQRPAMAAERAWYVEMLFHLALSGATGFNYWNPWANTIFNAKSWPPPAPGDDALLSASLSTLTDLSALGHCGSSVAEPSSAIQPRWRWVVDCSRRHDDDFLLSGVELDGCSAEQSAGRRLWRLSVNSSRMTTVQHDSADIAIRGVHLGSDVCDLIFKDTFVVEANHTATLTNGSNERPDKGRPSQHPEASGPAVQLDPPARIAYRTPEPGDQYSNGSNAGVLWFPHTITTLPSGVLLLRIAVHPDADMPYNHATILTSVDRGKNFVSQTPGCSNANVSACSLPYADDNDQRFGPTRSWEMAVPASTCSDASLAGAGVDHVLVAGYQSHLLGDGTSVGFDGTELKIEPAGAVSVMAANVAIIVTDLPFPIKDMNYTGCKDCGQPVDPPALKRRLASAHASNAAPIKLKGGGGLVTLLTDVTYADGTSGCVPSTKRFGPRCQYVLAISSSDCGRSWRYLSTITADGNEAGMVQLTDGRLLVVHRHNFDSTTPGDGVAYKHTFSSSSGASWTNGTLMTAAAGSVVPHSVMPTLRNLPDGGVMLSGGRGGLYLWHCATPSCVDKGLWVSTNVAASHNKLVSPADPFGPFPPACANESAWRQLNSCPSKEYLGLAVLPPAAGEGSAEDDTADFIVCYGHWGKVSQYGWCFTELGPGQEVYCARGSSSAGASSRARRVETSAEDGGDEWLVQDGYNAVSNDAQGRWPRQHEASMADCQAACLKRGGCGVVAFSTSTGSCYFRTDNVFGAAETLGPYELKRSSACRRDVATNCSAIIFPGVPPPPRGLWLLQQPSADIEVHCGGGTSTRTWPLLKSDVNGTCATPVKTDDDFDVVVYGATSGGITAAVAASRYRSKPRVGLIVANGGGCGDKGDGGDEEHIGGMSSGGLSKTDIGGGAGLIGGVAGEFYSACARAYSTTAPPHYDHEPHVASDAFEALLANSSVKLLRGGHGANIKAAVNTGTSIDRIELADGRSVAAKVFVDASYEGDLLAAATSPAAWTVGRESKAKYNEQLAGRRPNDFNRGYEFKVRVDPFDETGKPLPLLSPTGPRGEVGAADDRVQAYNFRLCATADAAAGRRAPFPPPDPRSVFAKNRTFELGRRIFSDPNWETLISRGGCPGSAFPCFEHESPPLDPATGHKRDWNNPFCPRPPGAVKPA